MWYIKIINGSPIVGRAIKNHAYGSEIQYFHSKKEAMKEYQKLITNN